MNQVIEPKTAQVAALNWIINFLEDNNISYMICGGLAAMAYGSRRPLHDIDMYIPKQRYQGLVEFGKPYISYGPQRYVDASWKVDYVQFNYHEQKIEVGSDNNIQIYDQEAKRWHDEVIDFSHYSVIKVLGRKVRVMEKQQLIEYKSKLGREVDKLDIAEMLVASA